jgi:hypothetical protein
MSSDEHRGGRVKRQHVDLRFVSGVTVCSASSWLQVAAFCVLSAALLAIRHDRLFEPFRRITKKPVRSHGS